jgi:23S rRNA (guanosine2251-2'-O)-methyltransferase
MRCLIYGKHSSLACLLNRARKIVKVWCTKSFAKDNWHAIEKFNPGIVSTDKLDAISKGGTHQGIVVEAHDIPNVQPELLYKTSKRIVVLDKLEDPHNVGAIMRSAAAFNFDAIIVLKDYALTSTTAKVASGALEKIKIAQVPNVARELITLKKSGFWIVGLDCNGTHSLEHELLKSEKLTLVLGAEGEGIRSLVKKQCDILVSIPTEGSLNVSNAAAVAFYASKT